MSNEGSETGIPEEAKNWKVPEEPKSEKEVREQVRKEQIEEARRRVEEIRERARGVSPKILERVMMWTEKLSGDNADAALVTLGAIQNDFEEMLRDPESEVWDQYSGFRPEEIGDLFKILYGEEMEPGRPTTEEGREDIFRRNLKETKADQEALRALEKKLKQPTEKEFQEIIDRLIERRGKENNQELSDLRHLSIYMESGETLDAEKLFPYSPRMQRYDGWTREDFKELMNRFDQKESTRLTHEGVAPSGKKQQGIIERIKYLFRRR